MTSTVRVTLDPADLIRAIDESRRLGDSAAERVRLGRILGRAESVLRRSRKPAVVARWQPVADAARDAIERWRSTAG